MSLSRLTVIVSLALFLAGCTGLSEPERITAEISPVVIQHQELAGADSLFTLADSWGHRPYRVTARYDGTGQSAFVQLDLATTQIWMTLGEILAVSSRTPEGFLEVCQFAVKNPLYPEPDDSLTEMLTRPLTAKETGFRGTIRVRKAGSPVDANDIRFLTVNLSDRHCVGFAQCMPKDSLPDGKSLGYLRGHFCFDDKRWFDNASVRDLVQSIDIRTSLLPAR